MTYLVRRTLATERSTPSNPPSMIAATGSEAQATRQDHPFELHIRSESSVKADGFQEAKRRVDEWVNSICQELDDLIREIHEHKNPAYISDEDLARMCMQLPTLIYRLEEPQCLAQLYRDLSKVLEEELYHVLFMQQKEGTVAVREAYAASHIVPERITTALREYALNRIRNKRIAAERVFDAVRKIISWRMGERELVDRDSYSA